MAVLTHFRNPTEMRVCGVQLLYQGLVVIIIVMLPPSHQLQPDAPLTVSDSPCTFVPDTVYATPTPGAEGVFLRLPMTSKWECCSICRRNPLCFVGIYRYRVCVSRPALTHSSSPQVCAVRNIAAVVGTPRPFQPPKGWGDERTRTP